MRIYKHKRRVDGKVVESSCYYGEFRGTGDVKRNIPLFTDKTASTKAGDRIEQLVALRMAGEKPDNGLAKWLRDECPNAIRVKLAKWNIIDPMSVAAGKSLNDHIEDWAGYLAGRASKQYAKEAPRRAKRITKDCKWCWLSDLSGSGLEDWITQRLKNGDMASGTIDTYIQSIKALAGWLENKSKRIANNPFSEVSKLNDTTDCKVERRASSGFELETLLTAAENCPPTHKVHGMTGKCRSILYRVACYTGFRWSELYSLTKSSFDLGSSPCTVTVKAKRAKNKKKGVQVLHESLIDDLREHLKALQPTDKAFPGMWKRRGAEMLAIDLKAAGIPYVDEMGLKADFHALRHTFGSMMNCARVPLVTAQKLMRHSDPKLTANIYTHVQLQEKAAAIAQLPSIRARSGKGKEKVVSGKPDLRKSETQNTGKCTVSTDGIRWFMGLTETLKARESGDDYQTKNPGNAYVASSSGVSKYGAGEGIRNHTQVVIYNWFKILYILKCRQKCLHKLWLRLPFFGGVRTSTAA